MIWVHYIACGLIGLVSAIAAEHYNYGILNRRRWVLFAIIITIYMVGYINGGGLRS